jgi:hypothetical protein
MRFSACDDFSTEVLLLKVTAARKQPKDEKARCLETVDFYNDGNI